MATTNTVQVPDGRTAGVVSALVNESKSFTSTVGDISSFVTVPAGSWWLLQSLRAVNGEAADRGMDFKLTDGDGTTHVALPTGATPIMVTASGGTLAWIGQLWVPPNWRVYAAWYDMIGGSSCNWQYTAIQTSQPRL